MQGFNVVRTNGSRASQPSGASGNGSVVGEVTGDDDTTPTARDGDGSSRGGREMLIRALNIAVAAIALLVLSPVLLLITIAIRLDSSGPAIYRQLRVGLDRRRSRDQDHGRRTLDMGGRPFMLYKFRTMHVDAEKETGPVWSGGDDDRITRVGRVLRRHRLDELPQLWNVLKGDMCIVGPRPERPSLVSYLRQEINGYSLRHKVPPGITGWAQVNREPDQTLDDVRRKLEFDLEYMERRSVAFDLRVMARTVPVMLSRDLETEEQSAADRADHRPRREVAGS